MSKIARLTTAFQLRLGEMLGTDEVDGARWEIKLPNQIVKAGIKQ